MKISSWVEKEVRKCEHFGTENTTLRTGCSEVLTFHRVTLSKDMLIIQLSPFSLASKGRCFTPSFK